MMAHKICFSEEIWIIIPKLSLLLLLIWSPDLTAFRVFSAIVFGAMAIGEASSYTPNASKAKASAEKIFELLDQEPSIDSESTEGLQPHKVIDRENTLLHGLCVIMVLHQNVVLFPRGADKDGFCQLAVAARCRYCFSSILGRITFHVQSALDISNTVISNYSWISKNIQCSR